VTAAFGSLRAGAASAFTPGSAGLDDFAVATTWVAAGFDPADRLDFTATLILALARGALAVSAFDVLRFVGDGFGALGPDRREDAAPDRDLGREPGPAEVETGMWVWHFHDCHA